MIQAVYKAKENTFYKNIDLIFRLLWLCGDSLEDYDMYYCSIHETAKPVILGNVLNNCFYIC